MALTILLDDADSTIDHPTSRLYENPLSSWAINCQQDPLKTDAAIKQCLAEISSSRDRGEYIITAFTYELGNHFKGFSAKRPHQPLIQAWAFKEYIKLSKVEVDAWLEARFRNLDEHAQVAGLSNVHTNLSFAQFESDIEHILDYLRAGDSYQINHTYRIHAHAFGSPIALYRRLRERQPVRFGAYIENGNQYILSLSPELFIQKESETIKAMPMKGTANALLQPLEHLSADLKNQTENVMIVDLLRNDLSQLAQANGVSVTSLFDVRRHGDVLQMTSTIEAIAKPNLSLQEILEAVFPCGSVTGAPKKRSMEIINELEGESRGYYCGALGWMNPNGDFAFSVPIRTIEMEHQPESNSSDLIMGVGAGITIESNPVHEWEECRIKSSFLVDLPSPTGIFETILVTSGQVQALECHLDRMARSAEYLNIPFDLIKAKGLISSVISSLDASNQYRIRLDLSPDGQQTISKGLLAQLPTKVAIFWAKNILKNPLSAIVQSQNPLLRHKISHRKIYDEAWSAAELHGGFDALFTNELGFVTEGGRSSIFIKLANQNEWITPPIGAGVLPGVMRSRILSDPRWNAKEANFTPEDVLSADAIMLTNSLRGALAAYIK